MKQYANRPKDDVVRVHAAICSARKTVYSQGLANAVKSDGCKAILTFPRPDPAVYTNALDFRHDYLCYSFLSKYKGAGHDGLNTEQVALTSFAANEDHCRIVNADFEKHKLTPRDGRTESLMFEIRQKISNVLGVFCLDKVTDRCAWGPGSTYEIPRRMAQVDLKMHKLPIATTSAAKPYFKALVQSDLHWSSVLLDVNVDDVHIPYSLLDREIFEEVRGCSLTTVAKNAKTDRVIAIEPRANGFLQKGVGSFIRSRLQRFGIDLDDQFPNQHAARCAGDRKLATLDLEAASDTVAKELVFDLLPVDWALYLNSIRSHNYRDPTSGEFITLEKFSSMGNGFTFELESLIFYAISDVVSRNTIHQGSRVFVYGDDIICSQESAPETIVMLNACGFKLNREKSYTSGRFYESCGRHYFDDIDVTPIYQKEKVHNVKEVIRMGNRIRRYCSPGFRRSNVYDIYDKAWRITRSIDPASHIFWIPNGTEGDDGWLVFGDETPGRPVCDVNLGLKCRVISNLIVVLPAHESSLLAWALRSGLPQSSSSESQREDRVDLRVNKEVLKSVSRWVMPTSEFGRY